MRSRISFCRKELIINNLKMYGMLSILWGVYLFLIYPLYLVNYPYEMDVEKLGMYLFSPAVFIPFLVSLIGAMILFHFLKTDNGVAFHMSLPATKIQIFFSQFLSGLILYLVPLLINFCLMVPYCFFKVKEGTEQLPTLLMQWLIFMILLFVANFFIATAIGMITGSAIWQIVFIAIYFGLPTYFDGAGIFIGQKLLQGFADQNPWHDFFKSIDIFRKIFFDGFWGVQPDYWEKIRFLAIYSVLAFVVAYLLYRFKKMESNREWVSFRPIKYFFIVGVTFCMVALMSAFFSLALFQDKDSNLYFYIGAVIGAILGYIISAMIAWKTVYLKKAWLGVFAAMALTIGIFGAIDIDLFGFERYIPRAEEIESIYFNSDHFALAETELYKLITPGDDIGYRNDSYYFKEPENIERMRQIHQHILKDKSENSSESKIRMFGYISISYYLKDGRTISRRYREVDFIDNPFYQELMQSEEIIKKRYVFLDEEEVKKLTMIKVSIENGRTEESFTGKEMQELLTILQTEVRQAAKGPEEMEVRTNGENEIIMQKHLPIRIRVLFEDPDSKKNQYNHLPRATREGATESWMADEYSYMFYGQAPKLREWLKQNSKALDVTLEQDEIEKLVFYQVSDYDRMFYRFNDWGYYDWAEELDEAPIAEVTAARDFDKYLAVSGRITRYSSSGREIVLMVMKLQNGQEHARQILPEDYRQIVK